MHCRGCRSDRLAMQLFLRQLHVVQPRQLWTRCARCGVVAVLSQIRRIAVFLRAAASDTDSASGIRRCQNGLLMQASSLIGIVMLDIAAGFKFMNVIDRTSWAAAA